MYNPVSDNPDSELKTNKYSSFFILVTLGIVFSWLFSACQPVPELPQPTVTPTPKIADTPFPTSEPATPISISVVVTQPPPTPEAVRPAGEVISTDTFEDGKLWNSAANANGNIVASGEKITLAVKSNMGTLSEIRGEWLPDNYYLEVTAEVRLCRGKDMFGILFRAPNDQSGYRF